MEKITEDMRELEMHSAVRNVMRLFDRIRDYEKRVIAKRGVLCAEDHEALIAALRMLARVLMPFAPHIAEELLIASPAAGTARSTRHGLRGSLCHDDHDTDVPSNLKGRGETG